MQIFWKAIYNDGTYLVSSEEPGSNHYGKIDRSKLIAFDILDKETEKLIFRLVLEPEQRLIYRKRNYQDVISGGEKLMEIIMVGWQQTINGKNIQSISHIFDDGHVEQAGNWITWNRDNRTVEYSIGNEPILREDEK